MITRISGKDLERTLTDEEKAEITAAAMRIPVFDEDSPEMTAEMLEQFKKVNRDSRMKPTVSIRLSPETLRKAKKYGKGYTAFLSRLLDAAINDEAMVRKCI